VEVVRSLHLLLLVSLVVSGAACTRTQARTPPPVVMLVPPPPPPVVIPVSLPEQPEPEPEPEPPAAAPTAPARPRPEAPARPVERPSPPTTTAATPDTPTVVLETTANTGALERRTSWLISQAEKDLERVNRSQLAAQARAQFDRAMSFVRNARGAMQRRNFSYAEQLATKAALLARELVKG
jgi:hypothetical protein